MSDVQEEAKNLTVYIEAARIVASMITAAGASYLGFWFACRRDDRSTIKGCLARILFWRNRIEAIRDHGDVCRVYKESVPVIHEPVINAMMLFRAKRQKSIQKAWDDYSRLKPDFMRSEDFPHPEIPTDILPVDRSSESGYYAVLRTLDALRDALS